MTTLRQKYYLSKKSFELTDRKVIIKENSVFDDQEWDARYNELGLDVVKIKSREGIGNAVLFGGLFILSVSMTVISATDGSEKTVTIMTILFSFLFGVCLWWSIQKYFAAHFILRGGQKTLTFFINSPNEKTVRNFIDQIRERTKGRLKEDLTQFDPDLNFEDQLNSLKYLKNIDVIYQDEFEIIREQLREKHLIK